MDEETFFKYVTLDDKLARTYAMAQRFKADLLVEEAIEIADSDDNPFKARNRIDIRKFAASKYNAQKFGDKLDLTVSERVDLRGALEDAKNRSRLVTQLADITPQSLRAATESESVATESPLPDSEALRLLLE